MKLSVGLLIVLLSTFSAHAKTRYPVVFAHGFLASRSFGSWQNVARQLKRLGYRVYVTEVSSVNTVSYRSRQLERQIEWIRWRTRSAKVNIVAHSMGGLDSRLVIHRQRRAPTVASLSTISTPHYGSSVARIIYDDLENKNQFWIGIPISIFSSFHNLHTLLWRAQFKETLWNLTPTYATKFNTEVLDSPHVYYQSWAAASTPENMHTVLHEAYEMLLETEGDNDGLVSTESARWGEFKGTLNADHIAVIGAGRRKYQINMETINFYRELIDELAGKGF